MAYISNTQDVREEALNVLQVDEPDEDIQEEQAAAYDFVAGEIGDYASTHPRAAGIRKVETIVSAAFVLRHYSQYMEQSDKMLSTARLLLDQLKKGLTGPAADISNRFSTTLYSSYSAAMSENPLQTKVRPYSSMKPFYY